MSNLTLKLLISGEAPGVFTNCANYPVFEPSIYCLFPGWIMEITQMLAQYTNITIIPVVATEEQIAESIGGFTNGTWSGFLKEVLDGNVDTIASYYQFTHLRSSYFEYSYPVYNIKIIYVAKYLRRRFQDYIWNTFDPYSTSLWVILAMSLILQSLYGTFIRYTEKKMELVDEFHPLEKFWQYCRLHVLQGDDKVPFASNTGSFAFIIYALLQVTLFTNLYQALLLSALLQETKLEPFTSAEQMAKLVKNGEYSIVTYRVQYDTTWFYDNLNTSSELFYVNLRDAIKYNPIIVKNNIEEVLDMIEHGQYIFITQEEGFGSMEIRELCNLAVFSKGLPEKSGHYLFLPNSSLVKIWNQAILMNGDFIRRTYYKYFQSEFPLVTPSRCSDIDEYQIEAMRPLDIISVFGIFLIYLMGLGCALIAFIVELYVFLHIKIIIKKKSPKTAETRNLESIPKSLNFYKTTDEDTSMEKDSLSSSPRSNTVRY